MSFQTHRTVFGITIRFMLLLLLVALGLGCQNRIQSASAVQFSQSVTTVRTQALTAFTQANDLVMATSVERAVRLPNLKDSDLPVIISAPDAQAWENALSALEAYATKLARLTSPQIPQEFEESIVALAEQLKETKPAAFPSPGVATAFAKIGSTLIAMQSQREAQRIAQATDGHVRELMLAMADAVGTGMDGSDPPDAPADEMSPPAGSAAPPPPDAAGPGAATQPEDATDEDMPNLGLRGTVASNYRTQLDALRASFIGANEPQRRQVVRQYLELRRQRDAHDLALLMLRRSLLALADAHTAMAAGDQGTVLGVLSSVRKELEATRKLFDRLDAIKTAAEKKEKEERQPDQPQG